MDTLKDGDLKMNEKEKELLLQIDFRIEESTINKIINNFNNYFPELKIEIE